MLFRPLAALAAALLLPACAGAPAVQRPTATRPASLDAGMVSAADPRAAEYLRTWYQPTGRLTRPMLAIHTTYDPIVPVNIPNFYQELTTEAGSQDLFVQQYVEHDGHCNITPEETAQGFRELRDWKNGGSRPPAGPAR